MKQRLWLGALLTLVVLGLGGWVLPYVASAEDGKIKGLAAGLPVGGITLSAALGNSSAEFQVGFGDPAILFPVVISLTTQVEVGEGVFPATLSNGDAVEVEGSIDPATGKLQVSKLELENFLELEIKALIVAIPTPGNTLTLPLAPGPSVTVTFSLAVSGVQFPMVITSETRVDESTPSLVLNVDDQVEFEAIFRDGEIRVIKIKKED